MNRLFAPVAACTLALVLTACSGGEGEPVATTTGSGSATAAEAVAMLVEALQAGDYDAAASLVADGQMRLILLAEGSTVKDSLVADPSMAARNFWASFADVLGPDVVDGIAVRPGSQSQTIDVRGVGFAVVPIVVDGNSRSIVARNAGSGWDIDVVASFAEVLGARYPSAIERALGSPEADDLGPELRALAPSLAVVLELPGLDGTLQQTMLIALGLLGG